MARMMRKAMTRGQGLFFSAKGSVGSRLEFGGNVATAVSAAPNGRLILARAFTAQPLASRIGPRLRLRSLSQAMIIDGNEIRRMIPTKTSGICHVGKRRTPV